MASRNPATSHAELIAVVASLQQEVAGLSKLVEKLDKELQGVTEFKNRSVYMATGVAIGFSTIGALFKTMWDFLKS